MRAQKYPLFFYFYFLQYPLAACCLLPVLRGYCICHLLCHVGREAAIVNIQESWHFHVCEMMYFGKSPEVKSAPGG